MTNSTGSAYTRLADALTDPNRLYESPQVAYLMGLAGRWGYEAAMGELEADELSFAAGVRLGRAQAEAEMNHGYPPPPFVVVAGVQVRESQAAAREIADADRSACYAGGPVADWGPAIPGIGEGLMHTRGGAASFPELDGVSVRVRTVAGRVMWAEEA